MGVRRRVKGKAKRYVKKQSSTAHVYYSAKGRAKSKKRKLKKTINGLFFFGLPVV